MHPYIGSMALAGKPLLWITAVFWLAACDFGPGNVELGNQNQVLHMGNGTEPQDLDPHVTTGIPEHTIITALLEGLVNEDPQTLEPRPGQAERWTISDHGRVYTFHIRDNARWSNGDPVTADDFVWSWQRLLSPEFGAEYAYQLFPVKNARAFNRQELDSFEEVGVKALDSRTLQVTLEYPTPYFLSLLSHYSTFAVHPPTVLQYGDMTTRGTLWTRPGNFVGNGPFTLHSWRLNYLIEVRKNPDYWDASRVRLNAVRFYPIDDAQTEERMFRTGALHVTSTAPAEKIRTYQADHPHLISISPYLGTYFYRFNVTRPPLDDFQVRRAMSMTVDRSAIIQAVTRGGQLPAFSFTPPGTRGYSPPPGGLEFDPEGARDLLARAGYPGGEGFPELELLYNTSDAHRRIAEAIQQMWQQELGIRIRLANADWKVYLSRTNALDYDISRAGWIGDYPDPNTFLDMMVTGNGNNRTGWSNRQYDELIRRAATRTSQQLRYQDFARAESILDREAPLLPIYTYTSIKLRTPSLQGWYPNILNHHPLKHVYLDPGVSAGAEH